MDNKQNLKYIANDIWCSEDKEGKGPFKFGIRMTVVRLEFGGLWLHSPVNIDDSLAGELKEIGPVEHIVAPNCFHYLYASGANEHYPGATL